MGLSNRNYQHEATFRDTVKSAFAYVTDERGFELARHSALSLAIVTNHQLTFIFFVINSHRNYLLSSAPRWQTSGLVLSFTVSVIRWLSIIGPACT